VTNKIEAYDFSQGFDFFQVVFMPQRIGIGKKAKAVKKLL